MNNPKHTSSSTCAFIDLGCFDGDSIVGFFNWSKLYNSKANEFEVYGFDASPLYTVEWEKITKLHPNVTFERKAAWTEEGTAVFNVSPRPLSSTLMREKRGFWRGKKIKVATIDFSEYLKQFEGYDACVVKIDIEGAEIPVLEKMISDKTVHIPTYIFIEWHDTKLKGDYTPRRLAIEKYLNDNSVPWGVWE